MWLDRNLATLFKNKQMEIHINYNKPGELNNFISMINKASIFNIVSLTNGN